MSKTALYRHWRGETLLYVGISSNPFSRLGEHSRLSAWIEEVDRVTIEWLSTRATAEVAEVIAVQTERPLHNVALTGSAGAIAANVTSVIPPKLIELAVRGTLADGRPHRIGDVLSALGNAGETARRAVRRQLATLVASGEAITDGHVRAPRYQMKDQLAKESAA